jgi:hypothetical protein
MGGGSGRPVRDDSKFDGERWHQISQFWLAKIRQKNTRDQLLQFGLTKILVGIIVTLRQFILDFGVQMFIFCLDEQLVYFGMWPGPTVTRTKHSAVNCP